MVINGSKSGKLKVRRQVISRILYTILDGAVTEGVFAIGVFSED